MAAAVRRAPRAVVVREVALQVLLVALSITLLVLYDDLLVDAPVDAFFAALVAVATGLVLLARLRWPSLATIAVGGLLLVGLPGTLVVAPLVAFSAGRRETNPAHLIPVLLAAGSISFAVVLTVLLVFFGFGAGSVIVALFTTLVIVVVLLLLPALCGLLLGQRRPAVRLLAERNAYLERVHSLTAAQARLEERARIAGEMHDVLGHRLSLLSVHAGALEMRAAEDAPRLSEHAQLVRATAVAALDELRDTLDARPGAVDGPRSDGPTPEEAGLDPGETWGSEHDVRLVVEHWREAGTDVSVAWADDGGEPLDPRVRRAVDRVVREGLTNAHKHAPGTAVLVSAHLTPQVVRVCVATTAPPRVTPPGPGTGLGLLGLTERARLLGGRAVWGPVEGGGFELVVEVPSQPSGTLEAGPAVVPDAVPPVPHPPQVQPADVLTWRRVAAVLALAAVFALPLAATLRVIVIDALIP